MQSTVLEHPIVVGRIVSLAMLADGWVGQEERSALVETGVLDRLGLDLDAFERIFESFIAETSASTCDEPCIRARITSERVDELLMQIRDPATQALLLDAMIDIANADGLLTQEEAQLLCRAKERWPKACPALA